MAILYCKLKVNGSRLNLYYFQRRSTAEQMEKTFLKRSTSSLFRKVLISEKAFFNIWGTGRVPSFPLNLPLSFTKF